MISSYHQLWQIEKAFRMSKHDVQARPIYHRTRDSIEAHLTIVFASLAVSRWIEHQTGWSVRKFVKTARRYRTIEIQAGTTSSRPPIPYPTNSAKPSTSSTAGLVRSSLIKVGLAGLAADLTDQEPAVQAGLRPVCSDLAMLSSLL